MKKLLFLLILFCAAAVSYGQSGYTTINSRYNWLGGLFKALGVPSGGTVAFQSGQAVRAGAIYYDSTGVDSGLYVWSGLAWRNLSSGGGFFTPDQTSTGATSHNTDNNAFEITNNGSGVFYHEPGVVTQISNSNGVDSASVRAAAGTVELTATAGSGPTSTFSLTGNASETTLSMNVDSLYLNTTAPLIDISDSSGYYMLVRRKASTKSVGIAYWPAPGTSGTPGIDDVLAEGQALTAQRTIDAGLWDLTFTGAASTPYNFLKSTTSTFSTQTALALKVETSGTAANNLGVMLDFFTESSAGSMDISNRFISSWKNATTASRESQVTINGVDNASEEAFMNIQKDLVRINNNADTLATRAYVRTLTPITGTYAQRIAAGAADGLEWFQTNAARDAPPGKYYYINSQWNYVPLTPERLSYNFEDFNSVGAANTVVGNYVLTATGSIAPNAPGAARFSTAAGTTGRAVIYHGANGVTNAWWDISAGSMYVKVRLRDLVQLSTVAEEFILRIGLSNQTAGTEPTDGIYLMYDRLTSANWIMVNAQNSGGASRTETPSGTAVATGAHTIEIFNDGTTSEYWLNGTSLGTISTTPPNAAMFPTIQLVKSAGTTPALVDVDYIKSWYYLTTQRN